MRLSQWISLVAFVLSLYIIWRIRQIVLLAFTAIVIATILNRLVRQFQKSGLKRGIAVTLSIVLVLLVLSFLGFLVIPSFVNQFQQLIDRIPQFVNRIDNWLRNLQEVTTDGFIPISSALEQFRDFNMNLLETPDSLISDIFSNFVSIFSSTLSVTLNTLLIIVLTVMLLVDPQQYRDAATKLFPASHRNRVIEILDQCDDALGGWAVGILFNMTVITILSGMGLWILGVSLVLANALIAGLLTLIPNIGPTLSVIPPVAIALLDAPWKAVAVLLLYIAIQQLESNVLTPLVMQRKVDLLPAVTLLSQVICAVFFGFLGLLLALPLVVVLQVLIRELLVKDILNYQ